jgi:hypothetical protein
MAVRRPSIHVPAPAASESPPQPPAVVKCVRRTPPTCSILYDVNVVAVRADQLPVRDRSDLFLF